MLFLLCSIITINLVVLVMSKKISRLEVYSTSLFALVLQLLTDIFLEFKYELYWYFEKGVDSETLLIIFGVYPQINIIFLNFFPFKKKLIVKAFYIMCWSMFAILYEWLFVLTDVFHHEDWKLWYSVPIYPLLYVILLVNFLFTKKLARK